MASGNLWEPRAGRKGPYHESGECRRCGLCGEQIVRQENAPTALTERRKMETKQSRRQGRPLNLNGQSQIDRVGREEKRGYQAFVTHRCRIARARRNCPQFGKEEQLRTDSCSKSRRLGSALTRLSQKDPIEREENCEYETFVSSQRKCRSGVASCTWSPSHDECEIFETVRYIGSRLVVARHRRRSCPSEVVVQDLSQRTVVG